MRRGKNMEVCCANHVACFIKVSSFLPSIFFVHLHLIVVTGDEFREEQICV